MNVDEYRAALGRERENVTQMFEDGPARKARLRDIDAELKRVGGDPDAEGDA